jgi:hypothetical protein
VLGAEAPKTGEDVLVDHSATEEEVAMHNTIRRYA